MSSLRLVAILRVTLIVGVAAIAVLIQSTSTQAQAGPPRRSNDSDVFREMRERRNREAALRGSEINTAKRDDDPRRAQIMVEKMTEDFRRLQLVRNEMVRALKAAQPLDYKSVADKTAEVQKRASRLRATMALNNTEPNANQIAGSAIGKEEMKAALIDLCNGIITFIESPVFKSPGVSNVKETAEARRVLQNIIDLSGGIRKSAEALSKNDE